jgi:Predicted Rossmann fold nucleotide-binding protein involved in DNA uptake
VPGSIDSAGSRGTNKLIKQGAILIENIDDILEEIMPQIEFTTALKTPRASGPAIIEKKAMKYWMKLIRRYLILFPGDAFTLMI